MACDNLPAYEKTIWVNGTVPAINALNLNHIEDGIENVTTCATEMKETLEDIELRVVPVGSILMWNGGTVPDGWALCDGSNGTPNLIDKFIKASTVTGTTGGSADIPVVSHGHTGTSSTTGDHSHTVSSPTYSGNLSPAGGSGHTFYDGVKTTSTDGDHSHTITVDATGVSGVGKNIPPFYTLMYIMKI